MPLSTEKAMTVIMISYEYSYRWFHLAFTAFTSWLAGTIPPPRTSGGDPVLRVLVG
jgi:hypothetical protein